MNSQKCIISREAKNISNLSFNKRNNSSLKTQQERNINALLAAIGVRKRPTEEITSIGTKVNSPSREHKLHSTAHKTDSNIDLRFRSSKRELHSSCTEKKKPILSFIAGVQKKEVEHKQVQNMLLGYVSNHRLLKKANKIEVDSLHPIWMSPREPKITLSNEPHMISHGNSIIEVLNCNSKIVTVSFDRTARIVTQTGIKFGKPLKFSDRPTAGSAAFGRFAVACLNRVKLFTARDHLDTIYSNSCVHQISLGQNDIMFSNDQNEVEIFDLEKQKQTIFHQFPNVVEKLVQEGPVFYCADSKSGLYACDRRSGIVHEIAKASFGRSSSLNFIDKCLALTTESGWVKTFDFRVNSFVIAHETNMEITNAIPFYNKSLLLLNNNLNVFNLDDLLLTTHLVDQGTIRSACVISDKLYTGGFDGYLKCFNLD